MNVALYNRSGIKIENLNGFWKFDGRVGDTEKCEKNKNENKKRDTKETKKVKK